MNAIVILLASLIVCTAYTFGRVSMRMDIDKEEQNGASEAPGKWQLVLNALNIGDIELAHRLAIKYEFDQNRQIQKSGGKSGYTYFAKDAEGKVQSSTNSAELSRRIGKATSYVTVMIRKQKGRPVSRGDLKGWVFWKEA